MNILTTAAFLSFVQQPANVNELPPVSLSRDWADYLGLLFALALVIVGIFGTRYALRTLKAIERQTEHTVNSERPWLFLTVYAQGFARDFRTSTPINRLDWRISNEGNTVANVLEAGLRCKKCRGMEKLLTVSPNYGTIISFYDVPVAPRGSLDAWSSVETETEGDSRLLQADIQDIREKGDDFVAFGFVRYKDQFGRSHESRFCYYYAVPFEDFRVNLRAPADYHRCT